MELKLTKLQKEHLKQKGYYYRKVIGEGELFDCTWERVYIDDDTTNT